MNTLIITAHPSSKGFTHKIAERFKKKRESLGFNVEIVDLYDENYKLDFLSFEDPKVDFPNNGIVDLLQKKISLANEIVFIFPMWNLTEPAILKNFYDIVFRARFAFRYVQGKLLPVPLLNGKIAHFFITCDSNSILFKLLGNPLKIIWKFGRLKLCGIKIKNFIYFDKMLFSDDSKRENYLIKVEKIASKNL
jgi:putative NADPH-quinone reductase